MILIFFLNHELLKIFYWEVIYNFNMNKLNNSTQEFTNHVKKSRYVKNKKSFKMLFIKFLFMIIISAIIIGLTIVINVAKKM